MKLKDSQLTKDELIQAYRMIKEARMLDERLWQLNRIGKSTFNISGQGAEVGQVAMALAFEHDKDYFLPYYRDMAAVMVWGMSAKDILMGSLGKVDDPSSHGRQMPNHYGDRAHNIVPFSSTVTTQYPVATGVALAMQIDDSKAITLTATGEGSTSEGDFHEALNFAGVQKLPMVFVIENNGYAISTPNSEEFGVKDLSVRATGYGIFGKQVNGRDFTETYLAFKEAADNARNDKGATLIEMLVDRLTAHSSDDDQRVYRTPEDIAEMKENDCVMLMERQLLSEKILNEDELEGIKKELEIKINQATEEAEEMPNPASDQLMTHIYEEE
ncbi:thiamine pyrophosphate-dependent dehydrogenase E1 component subunit alpha [Companilactobacillus jidongensis]|uniref:thiamine pyrophosphate-dependent dehydrogenase E1 component subunit alpha n=1 Tax=Companilactobacillus jidongensis TaxID=2486006 RepID=UPI000F7B47AD|nr:thiamine pyrophosphate-dependent dehydrogenase E1 component subunit alpha [Companilactobacillus jidongensis]